MLAAAALQESLPYFLHPENPKYQTFLEPTFLCKNFFPINSFCLLRQSWFLSVIFRLHISEEGHYLLLLAKIELLIETQCEPLEKETTWALAFLFWLFLCLIHPQTQRQFKIQAE